MEPQPSGGRAGPRRPHAGRLGAAEELEAFFDFAEVSASDRALELAASRGRLAPRLALRCPRATAFDSAPAALQGARAEAAAGGAPFQGVAGHLAPLPFRAAAFDLVLCRNAIHHLRSPERAMSEAVRVLRP